MPKPPREVVELVAGALGRDVDGANATLVPGVGLDVVRVGLELLLRLPEFQKKPRPPDEVDDDRQGWLVAAAGVAGVPGVAVDAAAAGVVWHCCRDGSI